MNVYVSIGIPVKFGWVRADVTTSIQTQCSTQTTSLRRTSKPMKKVVDFSKNSTIWCPQTL